MRIFLNDFQAARAARVSWKLHPISFFPIILEIQDNDQYGGIIYFIGKSPSKRLSLQRKDMVCKQTVV